MQGSTINTGVPTFISRETKPFLARIASHHQQWCSLLTTQWEPLYLQFWCWFCVFGLVRSFLALFYFIWHLSLVYVVLKYCRCDWSILWPVITFLIVPDSSQAQLIIDLNSGTKGPWNVLISSVKYMFSSTIWTPNHVKCLSCFSQPFQRKCRGFSKFTHCFALKSFNLIFSRGWPSFWPAKGVPSFGPA
jgi:hypothetical protein